MIKATLLPFRGRIVYDGLVTRDNGTFGGEIKRLDEDYKEATKRTGLVSGSSAASVIPNSPTSPWADVRGSSRVEQGDVDLPGLVRGAYRCLEVDGRRGSAWLFGKLGPEGRPSTLGIDNLAIVAAAAAGAQWGENEQREPAEAGDGLHGARSLRLGWDEYGVDPVIGGRVP